jgi:CO/xanthine dehydrogenase FAD-binding subunit
METYRPDNLDEALGILEAHPETLILAGGTDLMVGVTYGGLRPSSVLALRRVDELTAWDDGLVGAGVTWSRLEQGPVVGLAEAARTVGSPQIRNAGTIGGNVGTASPAGDGLPFIAAVDAHIELASRRGRRSLRWDEFFTGPKQTALEPGELITGVRLPDPLPARQAFAKIGPRNAMVIAIASVCVVRDEDGTTRVGLGSVGPTPIRAPHAEEMISNETDPSDAALVEFQRLVSEEVRPITDHRSTASYRRHASGVIARRALERCLA